MEKTLGIILAGALALSASAAMARDLALIVTNTNYSRFPDVETDLASSNLSEALDAAGFEVLALANASANRMHDRFADRFGDLEVADRLVIVLVGHVVSDGVQSWVLGTDARRPNIFDVGAQGLAVSALMPILAGKPGDALLFVAPALGTGNIGPGLQAGFLPGEVAQGVSVIEGPESEILSLITDDILGAGLPVGLAVSGREGAVVGYGYLPVGRSFLPVSPEERAGAEAAAWEAAEAADDIGAYEGYLQLYPSGPNADTANARLSELRLTPEARAAAAETALGLNRDARREIQRNLSILGFDPRGIDGIFGNGTRAAIRAAQAEQGIEVTGFLTGNQIVWLQEAAATRSAELEEEARARQEEADRLDSAFWRETGRGETEDGLRTYLERYPDGLFSGLAQGRLDEIEAERQSSAAAADRAEWEAAEASDDVAGYERYLAIYPEGAFADEARTRVLALKGDNEEELRLEAARAEEARVAANPITRLLVERRLQQLGLEPGAVDGRFDDDTRKAIRNYQRARDLPATGYVSQATLVRMLAG